MMYCAVSTPMVTAIEISLRIACQTQRIETVALQETFNHVLLNPSGGAYKHLKVGNKSKSFPTKCFYVYQDF